MRKQRRLNRKIPVSPLHHLTFTRMNLLAFKKLPMGEQADLLRQQGHFLIERREDSFRLRLYALGDFYAEEWRVHDEDHILFIHLFQHSGGLREYLATIRLPEV
jgi:hypothetical protein